MSLESEFKPNSVSESRLQSARGGVKQERGGLTLLSSDRLLHPRFNSAVVASESEAVPKVSITVSLDLSPKRDLKPPNSDTEIQTNFDNSFKRSK